VNFIQNSFAKKLLFSLVAGAALLALEATGGPIQITVDTSAPLCTNFLGFGVQWSAYPEFDITEAAWQKVFERLDFMRLPLVRVMLQERNFCSGFDAQGEPIYHWENHDMEKLYRLLDYCERRHVAVVLGEWGHAPGKDVAAADAHWHQVIGDLLEHLCREKGYTCIRFYNLLNEPNSHKSLYADFGQWSAAIKGMNAEFIRRGLADKIKIIGPDVTSLPRDGFWVDLAAQQTAADLGAYDFHFYTKPEIVESGFLENFCREKRAAINRHDPQGASKPFFMGEAGMTAGGPIEPQGGQDSQRHIYEPIYGVWMTDYNIQCARAGMAGTIAWDLDDAMHTVNSQSGDRHDIHQALFKKWGFFNSLANEIGHPEDANLRPWYFTWSLMARSFPPGCETLNTSSPGIPGLRTLAAKTADGNFSLALVNDSDTPQEIHIAMPGGQKVPRLLRYNYFPGDRLVDNKGFPVPKETLKDADLAVGLNVSLPARSVVIFTSIK
jgi:hypothetical protein